MGTSSLLYCKSPRRGPAGAFPPGHELHRPSSSLSIPASDLAARRPLPQALSNKGPWKRPQIREPVTSGRPQIREPCPTWDVGQRRGSAVTAGADPTQHLSTGHPMLSPGRVTLLLEEAAGVRGPRDPCEATTSSAVSHKAVGPPCLPRISGNFTTGSVSASQGLQTTPARQECASPLYWSDTETRLQPRPSQ